MGASSFSNILSGFAINDLTKTYENGGQNPEANAFAPQFVGGKGRGAWLPARQGPGAGRTGARVNLRPIHKWLNKNQSFNFL